MAPSIQLHAHRSEAEFQTLIEQAGAYKQRSATTHSKTHAPILSKDPSSPIGTLLLGDSMIERFKTTGSGTSFGSAPYPSVMNAGVGGDKIANVLYRLGTMGLYSLLKQRSVGCAVLQMGTNNLRPKKALDQNAIAQYALVIETLQRAVPGIKILVTGLMHRKDIPEEILYESNRALEQLVRDYNNITSVSQNKETILTVLYLAPHPEITTGHLVDHVHLNKKGYSLFAEYLDGKLAEMQTK